MRFDPSSTYVHLTGKGSAVRLPGGDSFWSMPQTELERVGQGWLISEFEFSSDWSNWEMHPDADEFVYLLSGSVMFLLQQPAGIQEIQLSGHAAVVVPKGIWHTAKVHQASRMLFVTMGRGTQHRPA